MTRRRIFDREGHTHFVTFSSYRRRRLLDHEGPKVIVLDDLKAQLQVHHGRCIGFVVMPDHVHAITWFPGPDRLSPFMKQWKQRSSVHIKRLLRDHLTSYGSCIGPEEPVWQARYYDFNLVTERKVEEKLVYMHQNPVRAGLVPRPCDWPWSSARYYEEAQDVGVPIGWPE